MASFSLKRKKKKRKLATAGSLFSDDTSENTSALAPAVSAKNAVTERMEAQGRKAQAKAEQEYRKLLEKDPNAFAFDEVYDSIQEKRDLAKGESVGSDEKKSKYIEQLMENTKQREFEYERATERLHQKEQKAEEEIHGKANEVFVTGAYKKRLEERRQWELEQARKAELEAKQDVRKRGNLTGFYTGMLQTLTKPVGTEEEAPKQPESVSELRTAASQNKPEKDSQEKEESSVPVKSKPRTVVEVYRPGDVKRQREEDTKKKEEATVRSRVSKSAIEEARKRAMERRKLREAESKG